jgi:nucleotide-binding universal stress UspA family protein
MERLLIALDCLPEDRRLVEYLVRILKGVPNCEFILFHILPTASPDMLKRGEVQRIERVHLERPDLAGYFWRHEDEKRMKRAFADALEVLSGAGFAEELISAEFTVESDDLADIILSKAAELDCTTIVLGRRRLSRVKEFLLGSVSSTVLRLARGTTVWVVAT